MKSFLTSLIFPALLMFSSNTFSQERANAVTDLLPEWSFPSGIEGPAIDKNGNLYAVNFKEPGTIGIITPNGDASIYLTLPSGSVGNGIRFDKKGFMYIADYTMHNILKVDPSTKKISVFAHNSSMNQPNDIAISSTTEYLYASDPNWKDSTGNLWLINREGSFILLEKNIGTTNGIEVSPDGKRLYVNESIQRKVWVYDIKKDGTLENKKLFITFPDFGMDGMKCDSVGNLYITRHGKGTIVIISPSGLIINEIKLKGKLCSNIVLSKDEKKAYVTMADRGCFEVIALK